MSFSVVHGAHFDTLDLVCSSVEERENWAGTLTKLLAKLNGDGDPLEIVLKQVSACYWPFMRRN